MERLQQDLRFALRRLLSHPGLSLVVILSLAMGIGPNTAIFTLVNTAFLGDMGIKGSGRLVGVWGLSNEGPGFLPHSYPNFEDVRDHVDGFSSISATRVDYFTFGGTGANPERIFGAFVSPGYFQMLGVGSSVGRMLEESDTDGRTVVVISHQLWQRRFGGDPAIVGQRIEINRTPFEIIGVADAGFNGTYKIINVEAWIPIATFREVSHLGPRMMARDWRIFDIVGRLAPGVSASQAEASLEAVHASLRKSYPAANEDSEVLIKPLQESSLGINDWDRMTRSGLWLMAIVGLLLLIACGNVASLLLAQATARRREIATRLAMGAGRWTIVRQLICEALVLSLAGGLVGLLLATATRSVLWTLMPNFLTELTSLSPRLDHRVLLFTLGASILAGLIFSLAPASQIFSRNLMTHLYERDGDSRGGRWYSARNLLVVGQIALSAVSLVSAGLLIQNFRGFLAANPGFAAERLISTGFNLRDLGYDPVRSREFFRRSLEEIQTLPGVETVAIGSNRPLAPNGIFHELRAEGGSRSSSEPGIGTRQDVVSNDYFETLGIPIRKGRAFDLTDREDSRPVAVVNETLAEYLWGESDPVGRRLILVDEPDATPLEVVGVAANAIYHRLDEGPTPHFYRPREQVFLPMAVIFAGVETPMPLATLKEVEGTLQRLDPNLVLANGTWIQRRLLGTLWPQRMSAVLVTIFAGLALLLSATGIYGCMAYSVAAQRREIGIRMALGANHAEIRRNVLSQTLVIVGLGLAIGAVLTFFAVRVLDSMLYLADARSPLAFGVVIVLLLASALVGTVVPLRRALRVQPAHVLRAE